jgi:anti-sigma B factor antagonist
VGDWNIFQKLIIFFWVVCDFYLSLQQVFIITWFMDNCNIRQEGSTLYVNLEFELTVANSSALQEELRKRLSPEITKIVFDATDLVYISSSGIRVIIFVKQYKNISPQVVFMNCAKEIREIFDISGISNFVIYEDEEPSAKESEPSDDEDDEWQQKMAETKQKMLEHFSAHNDVVMYQMKLGQNE